METNQPRTAPPADVVSNEMRIQILLEEYRALYSLLTFRLTAMDRRLPAIGGTLAGILCSMPAIPESTRFAFLMGLPFALVWFFVSTAQLARSKEDHLRRIDEIERAVNRLAGEVLLSFQSSHPAKGRFPGGRTGFNAVLGIFVCCNIMLAACTYLTATSHFNMPANMLYAYFYTVLALAMFMIVEFMRLARYRPTLVRPVSHHQPRPER